MVTLSVCSGQQKINTTRAAAGTRATVPVSASNQRNFSSDKSVRMFSLTPIIKSTRISPKRSRTQPSPHITKVDDGKLSEKVGYKELSLSQEEVLRAEGGSQKLSELLADNELWGDSLCS